MKVNEPVNVLLLAAGLGTRMKSDLAKVLHRLGGRPLIAHALRSAVQLDPQKIIVVVGHQANDVEAAARETLKGSDFADRLEFVLQTEQRGTGHAVMTAREALGKASGSLIILYGDAPSIRPQTLRVLLNAHQDGAHAATLLTITLDPPFGYGRIVRDEENRFLRIVEEKDCTEPERTITEVNPGIYCFEIEPLVSILDRLTTRNAQGEYYLTDVPELLKLNSRSVSTVYHANAEELLGINTRAELAATWKRMRLEILEQHMRDGVSIVDPDSTYIDDGVVIGRDTTIHPQVIIEGDTRIGRNCAVHSWSHLINAEIGDECRILNSSVIVDSKLNGKNSVGPFAHLRMGTELLSQAVIGNFVEAKKSRLGERTKSMHLTYLGDATLGDRVNIGAGTVTCNYDGKNKHQTHIEDDVKIGSDTMLVAPVRVGRGSVSGAGSVITEDVPPDTLVAGVPARIKKSLRKASE
jgi:bifunctional UDP-N-acetylglucosamine pyrophosphorylase / glucosamine-1-phosphate N-acetyltransferase